MIPILTTKQIQDWDTYTIKNEPINSIDLMERASSVFANWFALKLNGSNPKVLVVASKGNNGGDGLAVARLLINKFFDIDILIADIQPRSSVDFDNNLKRLKEKRINFEFLVKDDPFPVLDNYDIIIDALFGSGLSRPISGYWAKLVKKINNSKLEIYSIDIPSGMYANKPTDGIAVRSNYCLSFEVPKLGMLITDNSKILINWESKSIGLSIDFLQSQSISKFFIEKKDIKNTIFSRNKFDHKGKYGHSLIIGGQEGMIGAATLASKACLRTGSGLVSALIPDIGSLILQITIPEVMTISGYGDKILTAIPDLNKYSAVGIGIGLGKNEMTVKIISELFKKVKAPLIIDADALNIISENKKLLEEIPKNSILTPHPGEFARLFGPTKNSFDRLKLLREKSDELDVYIVLKGAYTVIATPNGNIYFNYTGNHGMATAGSGDVLTGIITSLAGQGYSQFDSCLIGVYIHGLAGDIAAQKIFKSSLIASDIIDNIGEAYKILS